MKNRKHRTFQASKKLSYLRNLLLAKAEHITPEATSARKRSFADMLRELDNNEDDAGPSSLKKRSKKQKQVKKHKKVCAVISESSDESDTPESDAKLPHLKTVNYF